MKLRLEIIIETERGKVEIHEKLFEQLRMWKHFNAIKNFEIR